jgi:hypothetical protein
MMMNMKGLHLSFIMLVSWDEMEKLLLETAHWRTTVLGVRTTPKLLPSMLIWHPHTGIREGGMRQRSWKWMS